MDRVKQLVRKLRAWLGSARTSYELMAPRERWMVIGLLLVFEAIAVVGIAVFLLGFKADVESRTVVAAGRLDEVHALAASYQVLAASVSATEARMDEFNPNQISTYVENWSKGAGILPQLREVRELGSEVADTYLQRSYQIEYVETSYDGLLKLLYAMETAPFPVHVRTTKISAKTDRKSDTRQLNVNLEVVTYSRAEPQP